MLVLKVRSSCSGVVKSSILHSVLLCCIVDKNVDLSILFHNSMNYLHTKMDEQEDLNPKQKDHYRYLDHTYLQED
jgi:hypothetical protein